MELRYLKTFIAIVDEGGFAVAGQTIGLTQSAVSMHIKTLEDMLDTELFDRTKRPPLLTDAGDNLLDKAREIVSKFNDLKQINHTDNASGLLRLGAVPTVQTGILPGALANVAKHYPSLRVELTSGLSKQLVEKVYQGKLDVAFSSEPIQLIAGLNWQPITQEPLVVIAPKSQKSKTYRQLIESLPFVSFQRFTLTGQLIAMHLHDLGLKPKCTMDADSLEAIEHLVAAGLGVSVVPMRTISRPFTHDILHVPFGKKPSYRTIGLIERASNPKREFVNILKNFLLAEIVLTPST